MMADLGLQSYRFSISWSRVMPDGRGSVNPQGVDFYQRLVDRLLEHDIVPCPTLFHWDLPQGLEELGGFRNRDTVSWFGDYAALMVRELGDRVTMWSTFNEPWCYAYLGHAAGVHAPGLVDPHAAVTVAHHELLAHGLALQTMRAERDDLQLGIVINPSNIVSDARRPADDDTDASRRRDPQPLVVRRNAARRVPGRPPRRRTDRWPTPSRQATPTRSANRSTGSASTTTSTSSCAASTTAR